MDIEKRLEAWQMRKRKCITLITLISLISKETKSPEPFTFKGFPTNIMTKNPVSVSHQKLKQLNHQQ